MKKIKIKLNFECKAKVIERKDGWKIILPLKIPYGKILKIEY